MKKREKWQETNGAEEEVEEEEEEKKKKKNKKQFHCEVFRGSWRKKMGKVFICGLPLRSGPMAVLNRSQLRGVGIVLPSLREESPEVGQLKNNLLT